MEKGKTNPEEFQSDFLSLFMKIDLHENKKAPSNDFFHFWIEFEKIGQVMVNESNSQRLKWIHATLCAVIMGDLLDKILDKAIVARLG